MIALLEEFSPGIMGPICLFRRRHMGQHTFGTHTHTATATWKHGEAEILFVLLKLHTGINPKLHERFPWVMPTEDREGIYALLHASQSTAGTLLSWSLIKLSGLRAMLFNYKEESQSQK